MEEIQGSFFDAGRLEIARYLPPYCLEQPTHDMDLDIFIKTLAQARYMRELATEDLQRAIVQAFAEE